MNRPRPNSGPLGADSPHASRFSAAKLLLCLAIGLAGAIALRFALDSLQAGVSLQVPLILAGVAASLLAATLFARFAPEPSVVQTAPGNFLGHDAFVSQFPPARWEMTSADPLGSGATRQPYENSAFAALADSARGGMNPDDVYARAMDIVRGALRSSNACVFRRDAASGDFLCANWQPHERRSHAPLQPLRLKKDAFTIRRTLRLAAPLAVDSGDFAAWERSLENAPSEQVERRRKEIDTLQIARARLLAPIYFREECIGMLVLGPREANAEYASADRELAADLAAQLSFLLGASPGFRPPSFSLTR